MAYTIKGLAKANECEELDESGLAEVWSYWYDCGQKKQIAKDFLRLRKSERVVMLQFLSTSEESINTKIGYYLLSFIYA